MSISRDAYRQFQEELTALDQQPEMSLTREQLLVLARTEFLDLQRRYQLSVADVVGFFPEEEGIDYLYQLIETSTTKPRGKR